MHGGDSRLQYRQRNLDDADLVRHLPGRTLRSRRRGRLRLRHHALGRAAHRSSRSRAKLRRPRQRSGRRALRLPHPNFRGRRMVVAMDVRALGRRRRDAPGDGAAVARERAMHFPTRRASRPGLVFTTSFSRSIVSADHDDRLRARRRHLDHRRERLRLLPRRFGGGPVGSRHQRDDHRRRRTRTARLPARRMERGAIRPRADSRRLRHRNHRRTPVVLLGTAVAFRVAADVAVGGIFLVQRMRQRRHRRQQRRSNRTIPDSAARHNDRMVRAGQRDRRRDFQRRSSSPGQRNGGTINSSRRALNNRNPRRNPVRDDDRRNAGHVIGNGRQRRRVHLRELTGQRTCDLTNPISEVVRVRNIVGGVVVSGIQKPSDCIEMRCAQI